MMMMMMMTTNIRFDEKQPSNVREEKGMKKYKEIKKENRQE